ncbi:MAG: DUF4389 domain-containing protein [Saccharospirillum sp.]
MQTEQREYREQHGLRLLFMVLFWVILRLGYFVTALLAMTQWILGWFEDEPNSRLRQFSRSLARYQSEILDYLLFNRHTKPFPFDDWPSGEETQQ